MVIYKTSFLNYAFECPWCVTAFLGAGPAGCLTSPVAWGPVLGLILCSRHLETLGNSNEGLAFSFSAGPCQLCRWSCLWGYAAPLTAKRGVSALTPYHEFVCHGLARAVGEARSSFKEGVLGWRQWRVMEVGGPEGQHCPGSATPSNVPNAWLRRTRSEQPFCNVSVRLPERNLVFHLELPSHLAKNFCLFEVFRKKSPMKHTTFGNGLSFLKFVSVCSYSWSSFDFPSLL